MSFPISNGGEQGDSSCVCVQIGVGRLGVITEVELEIVPQDMLEREVFSTSFDDFVAAMKQLQDDYVAALNGSSKSTVADVLSEYEGTQASLPDCHSHPHAPISSQTHAVCQLKALAMAEGVSQTDGNRI